MEAYPHSHVHLHVMVLSKAQETYLTIPTYLNRRHCIVVSIRTS